ncbi:MAG: D-alanyl-D-alanine carboxypeptidase/D-alanyl-D-alanine-endopeptidase, partial [Mycobacteriales bacterium]
VAPASVAKITTAAAALAALGPDARITTRVVAGSTPGDVVLVGGGDPTLSINARQAYPGAARLDLLAKAVRAAYGQAVRRVIVDGSAFSGPTTGPGWDSDIVSAGFAAPVTALMVDGGRINPLRDRRSTAPDLAAGQAFARLLGAPATAVIRGRAPAGGNVLARVSSAPMSRLIEQMLGPSDNVVAEALIRQVAIASKAPADFTNATAAVRATLSRIGVDVSGLRLADGSGLSRLNRLSPALVTSLLTAAASGTHPELRPLLAGLPVAGFSGTLNERYRIAASRPGAGVVRAKTGSLSGVSTLAGVVRDTDGRLLAFAVLADEVRPGGIFAAEAALDRIAATLARCGCQG